MDWFATSLILALQKHVKPGFTINSIHWKAYDTISQIYISIGKSLSVVCWKHKRIIYTNLWVQITGFEAMHEKTKTLMPFLLCWIYDKAEIFDSCQWPFNEISGYQNTKVFRNNQCIGPKAGLHLYKVLCFSGGFWIRSVYTFMHWV